MSFLAALTIVGIALLAGYYVFRTRGGGAANATYDAFAVLSSTAWVLTGVFFVLGGFYLVGGVMIALFFWLALAKGQKTSERLRARLANQ